MNFNYCTLSAKYNTNHCVLDCLMKTFIEECNCTEVSEKVYPYNLTHCNTTKFIRMDY